MQAELFVTSDDLAQELAELTTAEAARLRAALPELPRALERLVDVAAAAWATWTIANQRWVEAGDPRNPWRRAAAEAAKTYVATVKLLAAVRGVDDGTAEASDPLQLFAP